MVTLAELGPRICILGPSTSGKSTLANAIGRKRCLEPIHLDQLRHYPNTNWQARPEAEFISLHDKAIRGDNWIMDGNYSVALPQRLAYATGIILLDISTSTSIFRYLRRAWFERTRHGQLAGSPRRVKWSMIRYILVNTWKKRRRYKALFAQWDLPKIWLATPQQLAGFYRQESLQRSPAEE